MNSVFVFASTGVLLASSIAIALGREARWSILAWWVNGLAASALLLGYDAEMLALVMILSSTVCSTAYFLHADSIEAIQRENRSLSRFRPGMILPFAISAGLGVAVVALIRRVMEGAVSPLASTMRSEGFSAEESFLSFQLVALLSIVAVVGAGVIARATGRENAGRGQHD